MKPKVRVFMNSKAGVIGQIYSTSDYSMFNFLNGNRDLKQLHVERLKKSFESDYLLSPIIVNEKFIIIDGQHRFNAAKAMGLPIYFIIVEGYGLEEVQLLNTTNEKWNNMDRLKSFCDKGYPEYIKMREFMDCFPDFGFSVAEKLLTDKTNGSSQRAGAKIDGKYRGRNNGFAAGELIIPDIDKSYENGRNIMMFKQFYDGYNRSLFVSTMIGMFKHPNYDHAKMIKKLKSNPNSMSHCNTVEQYKLLIEEIFNFRSRNKVSLRF